MLGCLLRRSTLLALLTILPTGLAAQQSARTRPGAVAEIRDAVRRYDDALRRADSAAVEKFWAPEYTFINPRGAVVTRSARLGNLRAGRTALDSLVHSPQDERIEFYGDVALYTTLLTLRGRYSGTAQHGQYRASVVWVKRGGRWQQVASQMTPVLAP